MNPEELVESQYDKISERYHDLRSKGLWTMRDISWFLKRLRPGSTVLDAGCGSGFIASKLETRGLKVTGIDVSESMLGLARKNAPASQFLKMNMRTVTLPPDCFEALVCFYAMMHIPRRFHFGTLRGFHRVLKDDGLLAIHMGWSEYVGVENDWLGTGAKMYWSHYGKEKNLSMVRAAGFETVRSNPSRQGDGTHLFVVARKPRRP